jgi:hypothetical protein
MWSITVLVVILVFRSKEFADRLQGIHWQSVWIRFFSCSNLLFAIGSSCAWPVSSTPAERRLTGPQELGNIEQHHLVVVGLIGQARGGKGHIIVVADNNVPFIDSVDIFNSEEGKGQLAAG